MRRVEKPFTNRCSLCAVSLAFMALIGCHNAVTRPTDTSADSVLPNVLFILVDDLGARDLAVFGSESYSTPNLDKLAESGTRYTNAYAASPVCSPSRAALMTGKAPSELQITDWITGWGDEGKPMLTPTVSGALPLEEITLAEHFKAAGYDTFFAGKWHLGDRGFLPTDQGFDTNKGGYLKGSPPGGYYSPYNNPYLESGPEGEYLPDRLTNETLRFINEDRTKPFFAMLSFYTVHTPVQASVRHIDQYRNLRVQEFDDRKIKISEGIDGKSISYQIQTNADYASMVSAMDENVGRLIDSLRELGILENTLVIFTSDNGGLATSPKRKGKSSTSNYPFRAGKAWLYEGGIRVPLIVKYPGIRKGSVVEHPNHSMDVFATMVSLITDNKTLYQRGIPLGDMDQHANRDLYWHYPHYHRQGWRPGSAIRSGDWKLIEHFETRTVELFNLKEDVSETQDLSQQFPEKTEALLQRLRLWREKIDAPMPVFKSELEL